MVWSIFGLTRLLVCGEKLGGHRRNENSSGERLAPVDAGRGTRVGWVWPFWPVGKTRELLAPWIGRNNSASRKSRTFKKSSNRGKLTRRLGVGVVYHTLGALHPWGPSGDIPAYLSVPAENCLSGPQWPTSSPTNTPAPFTTASVDADNLATSAASGQLSPGLLALCVLAPLLLLLFSFICVRNWCKKHQENALPSCIPLYWRVALADCFVSLRVGERAHLERRRREAEERERQRAESAVGKFSLGAAYSRPNSTVDQEAPPPMLLAPTSRQDAIPNPLIGVVPISRLPPPLLVPHGPMAGGGFPAPPPPPAKDVVTPTPGPEL